jgi:N-methylhydantoinase A
MEPTVSDADVVLGYLDRETLLGGALRIELTAAQAAIRRVADLLGLEVPDAAARIVEIVNANMAEALRIVSIERGHELSLMRAEASPRDEALHRLEQLAEVAAARG